MKACKLHRHHCQHCGTTTKVCAGGGMAAVILLSTQAAKLTQNWLK